MKTISILNLKGGVAKTFTAANMAYELYRRGYKVLLIDNDKQGNLSKAYSRYDAENVAPVTKLLAGDWENADELIQHTEYEGIDIVTANMSLFGATWNLTKELRYGGQDNSTAITRFTLAVDDGKDTDFINIKCFGRTAEWAQKWLSKGSRAEVTGKIKTGSYESQRTGSKVYYTEVVANSVGFGESKAEAEARGQQLPESDGFMNIPEGADEELPFN